MSCYMSDDEAVALPRVSELSSPIGGSVSVLDMINQDVMFGNCYQGAKSSADTQVTYVRAAPSTAPSASVDAAPPLVPTSEATDTFVKPIQKYASLESPSQGGKTMIKINRKSAYHLASPKTTRISTNPFETNPFVSNQNQAARAPYAATITSNSGHLGKNRSGSKTSSDSSKRSRHKTHSSHKRSNHSSSKSSKKSSRSSMSKNALAAPAQTKETTVACTVGNMVSTVIHNGETITSTSNISTQSKCTLTTAAVAKTATTPTHVCSVPTAIATVTSNTLTTVVTKGTPVTTVFSTPAVSTCRHTVTKSCAPVSIISPLRSTYLPANVLYSTPTIITRTPSSAGSVGEKACEQYTILPAPASYTISTKGEGASTEVGNKKSRTRLVIPVTHNAFASSTVAATTTVASGGCKQRAVHAVRPVQSLSSAPNVTSTVVTRAITHSTFTLPPGATIYTANNIARKPRPAVTTGSQTFTIVGSKGTYTTLTISPDFAAASASRLSQAQTTTASTGAVSTTSVTTEMAARPRSQLLIPIANSQMSTNTSLGYLVTSPVGASTSSTASPTTTIASHTITTISSEALNRIRSRLIYNVPSVAGVNTVPSTNSREGSKPRGPVTIIANQLISPVPRGEAAATSANPATRPLNRVVIPVMSNVHAATTNHSSVSTPGTYIIAGVNQSTTTANNAASRPSRVVIPIIHNKSTVGSSATTAAGASTKKSSVAGACTPASVSKSTYPKLRNRLTIQMNPNNGSTLSNGSPIASYTITKTRAPQNVHTIPAGSTPPYISVTKSSDAVRNPATMTLITFSPPRSSGAVAAHKLPTTESSAPTRSATITTTTPPLTSVANRFVIKLSTGGMGCAVVSTTASVTSPVTTAAISPTEHRFTEPHPISSRPRTFPGPRTYSLAQRAADAAVATASQHARTHPPRIKKVVTSPAPLQIFADVVCPQAVQGQTAPVTSTRFTLSQSPGTSTLVVPKYKNTVFKNLSTVAHANTDRTGSRLSVPRATSERLVLNRSVAFVSPRRLAPEASASATVATTGVASMSQRLIRSLHPETRSESGRTTDGTKIPVSNAPTDANKTSA